MVQGCRTVAAKSPAQQALTPALGRMWHARDRGRDRLRVRWLFSQNNFSQGCSSKRTGEQLDEERCHGERVMRGQTCWMCPCKVAFFERIAEQSVENYVRWSLTGIVLELLHKARKFSSPNIRANRGAD